MLRNLAFCLLITLAGSIFPAQADTLLTTAEKTNFQRTGRYDEMVQLCQKFKERWPDSIRVYDFGVSPEGRALKAIAVSLSGVLDPTTAREAGLPVILIQGCIHAGEVDGKDAGFMALRQLLENQDPKLKNCLIVFVPIFNVDGHERFKAWNRPNQNGPTEMGWRVTAQNLNLNRDYTKADTPEMQAMLALLESWDPILYVDLHATDGAKFQPDVAVLVEPLYSGSDNLRLVGKGLQDELLDRLRKQNWMPLPFYPSLMDSRDPKSGFANWAFTPRFSTGYWALRNRLTVLVETHSWKDYETRVKVTRDILLHLVEMTEANSDRWLNEARKADRDSVAGKEIVIGHETTKKKTMIDFPGYAYHYEDSPISGTKALVYDDSIPQNWRMPFYGEVLPKLKVTAPLGGYIIPRAQRTLLGPLLAHHKIQYSEFKTAGKDLSLEVFRAEDAVQSKASLEGRQTTTLTGKWVPETRSVLPGSIFVPIAQPKARLIMALLEPQAPDSFASWGFFNTYFEQKEYMESYVAESEGEKMMKESPEIAAEFRQRLAEDKAFRDDPKARLNFIHEHHPSWDTHKNMYPVFRTDERVRMFTF